MNGNISLGLGEAGCLLAHELVWQQISKRPDNEGYLFLVLEDDARITRFGEQNFQRILSSTNEISLDLVNLGKEIFRVDPTSKSTQKGLKLLVAPVAKTLANTMPPIFLADFDWRTRAYLISRNLASELVKHPLSFQKPVDQFLRETSQKSGFKARFKAMTLAQTVFGDSGRASLVDNLGRARDKRG